MTADEAIDVTVLIPMRNEGGYLKTTVPVMLDQDFDGQIEFLFMDGGSTDDSRAIVERFASADRRITLLAARIRQDGGRVVCLPSMAASYFPRASLKALGRQYARYGLYRVRTTRRHPRSFRRSQALPPTLALTAAAALVAPGLLRRPARAAVVVYGTSLLAATVPALRRADARDAVWLPLVLATMHLAYGFGFLAGCARFGSPLAGLRGRRPRRARQR